VPRGTSLIKKIKVLLVATFLAFLGIATIAGPFLKYFTVIIWITPIVVIYRKHGVINAVITILLSAVILFLDLKSVDFPSAALSSLTITMTFGILALIIGYCFSKEISPFKSILIIFSYLALSQIIITTGTVSFTHVNLSQTIQEPLQKFLNISKEQGLFIYSILPSLLIIDGLVTACTSYLGVYYLQKRLNIASVPLLAFTRWRLPWYLSWILIFGITLALVGDSIELTYSKYLAILGYNLVLSLLPFFSIIGLSICVFVYKKIQGMMGIKIILILLFILNLPPLLVILALIGAFDPFIEFRKHIQKLTKDS
jgi:uncharacterized protein YybS (DUF2232 family)